MFRLHIHSLAVLGVFSLVLAACGNDAGSPTTTASQPDVSTTTTTPNAPTSTEAPSTTTTSTTSPTTLVDRSTVTVYFSVGDGTDCSLVQGFEREIPASEDPITAAFDQLMLGPTAEETAAGAGSFFSEATAEAVNSISLDEGLLTVEFVDFRLELTNASASCGSASLLASLNETAFEFEQVERVRYTIFGSCNVFYNWLQRDCQDQTRTGSVAVDLAINELASGSGCTPGTAQIPDGDWFGYVDDAGDASLEFDLACWFTGAAAAEAAAEDGYESPPPNDYYIRNVSVELRTIPVGEGVEVAQLTPTGGPDTTTVSYEAWLADWASRTYQPAVWLTVTDGEVSAMVEQYQP